MILHLPLKSPLQFVCIVAVACFLLAAESKTDEPDESATPVVDEAPGKAEGRERSDDAIPDAGQRDKVQREAKSERKIVLWGKVFGREDRPIAGARFYLAVDEWTDPVELGTSAIDGSYRFAVPEKKLLRTSIAGFPFTDCQVSLIARANGLGPGWEELRAVKGGRLGEMQPEYGHDFHLTADCPITGRVVDGGGKPVGGAAVTVAAMHDLADPRWRTMPAAIKAGDPNRMTRREIDPNAWFTPLYPTAWRMIPPAKTDSEGRFQIANVGGDRAITLVVTGPGIHDSSISVLTRDDVADFTQAVRDKYPRASTSGASPGDGGVLIFSPSPTIVVDIAHTVAGAVRDAGTGEPIVGLRVVIVGPNSTGLGQSTTNSQGRYRMVFTGDSTSVSVQACGHYTEHYLTATRQIDLAKGPGETVVDFNIPRGVMVSGRVLESGTDRPIVSAPRRHCHDPISGGPLLAGYVYYYPLGTNKGLRGTELGLCFDGANYCFSAAIDGDGRFRIAVPPGPGVLLVKAEPGRPMFAELTPGANTDEELRLFPYATLATRAKGDGAPNGDAQSFPGFGGPIPLGVAGAAFNYHAYRVIAPPADAKTLALTLHVSRAATQ